jgi:phenylacetate-CoA ligase
MERRDLVSICEEALVKDNIARFFATAGTTAEPLLIPFTQEDMKNVVARETYALKRAQVTSSDIVHVAFAYGLFIAGLAYDMSLTNSGITVVPAGSGASTPTKLQVQLLKKTKATVLLSTPSYALRLAGKALEMKLVPSKDFNLEKAVFSGELVTPQIRKRIEDAWDLQVFDNYGLTECGLVACDCLAHVGLHILPNQFVVEVIDPTTLKHVSPGEEGELVLSDISKQSFPLIRYRTGDIVKCVEGNCECGSGTITFTHSGRTIDFFKIKGVKVGISQLESALYDNLDTGALYRVYVCDAVEEQGILIVLESKKYNSRIWKNRLANELSSALRITVRLKLVPIGSLPENVRKGRIIKRVSKAEMSQLLRSPMHAEL